jgi:hypothetical protein
MATLLTPQDEIAALGEQIYETRLRQVLEPDHVGKYVAIDVKSDDYVIADTILDAAQGLAAKNAGVESYVIKIGYSAAVAMGSRLTRRPPRSA